MKTFSLSFFLVFSISIMHAQAPSGYYAPTEGLVSYELKSALKIIIDDIDDGTGFPVHQDQGYGALYEAYADLGMGRQIIGFFSLKI